MVGGGRTADTAGSLLDALDAFAPRWVRALEWAAPGTEWTGRVLGGAGVLADASDVLSPQDHGALGWADRGAAVVNGGLLVADMVMVEIPVVGEVAIAATGLYLAGDYLYHHSTFFHDAADEVGHATVTATDDVDHAIGQASHDVSHDASATWHSVTSSVGSWF